MNYFLRLRFFHMHNVSYRSSTSNPFYAANSPFQVFPLVTSLSQKGFLCLIPQPAGDTLIYTLETGLGDKFTTDTREAWLAVYGIVADTMKAGAREVKEINGKWQIVSGV